MPRHARKRSGSGVYHVMLRGINKQSIFGDSEDKTRLFDTLKRYKQVSNFELYGYCFMNNHIHILIRERIEPISLIIKRISSSYVYWFNWKYERVGHLLQERFKSEAVEEDAYFLTVLRYIHQNPIKAGLTKSLFDFKWSSIHDYIKAPVITDTFFALNMFSKDREKAVSLFLEFMKKQNDDHCLDISEKARVSDEELKALLSRHSVYNINQLLKLEKSKRYEIIRSLKSIEGITVRQLSRLTGISKSNINRI